MSRKILIHAPSIHQGGGKSLLFPLLKSVKKIIPVMALLDKRLELPDEIQNRLVKIDINSTLLGRIIGEYKLSKLAKKFDIVLCLGNLPPLFKVKANTILFVQNRYLVSNVSLDGFSAKNKMRIFVERVWLRVFISRAQKIIVQTPAMKKLVKTRLSRDAFVIPFFDFDKWGKTARENENECEKIYDFIYVATGEPQKNHINLVEAWKLLAKDNIYPTLCLTLSGDKYTRLVKYIDEAKEKYGLNIYNIGICQQKELVGVYRCSRALIYPSKLESFGLPLVEAKHMNLPVLASELDYVRDILDPEQTFNPESSTSISKAVKRFLGFYEQPIEIIDSTEFLELILQAEN